MNRTTRVRRSPTIEPLELRQLLAAITVDANSVVRQVDATMVGTNVCWWQGELDTTRIGQMIADAGFGLLRMPGGSSSNNSDRHFDNPPPWNGYKTPLIMARVVEAAGADGMISINYGSGSPQEAAAYLAYYNAQVGDPTVIGIGKQWDSTTRTWGWKDWKTAGYWASLRAAAPLAVNDGLNHLRAAHPDPWGFTYWEIGNENFATWETNEHTYGGTATATGSTTTGNEPVKAFDENKATKWVGQFSGSSTLQYQFFNNEPHVVRHYRLTSSADIASHPNRAPRDWALEASNDGSNWTTLDTRTNQATITNGTEKTYAVASPAAYRYYRLRITALRGAETSTELAELRLMYDAVTYVNFAKTFSDLAHQIDPKVRVGLVATLPMQWNLPNQTWTQDMLQASANVGLAPGFLSDHVYVTGQSDQNLLLNTVNKPGFGDGWAPLNWSDRTAAYRAMLNTYLGSSAGAVEIMLTEFNSDLATKQPTNLVGGLWIADAMAGAMQTQYTTALQWDLTNGYSPLAADPTRYGWRQGSDNGMISTGSGPAPTSGAYVPYPAYFGASLASMLAKDGIAVVRATSDDPYLSTYAVRQKGGGLYLLAINKSPSNQLTGNFSLNGFYASSPATFYRYGIAEDTAQSLTTDGAAAFTVFSDSLALAGTGFSYAFPAYSMTLIKLSAAAASPTNDVYVDALAPTWSNWSWDSTVDLASTSQVHAGTHAIAVTSNAGWSGFSLRNATDISTANYSSITFWVHGGTASNKPLSLTTMSADASGGSTAFAFTAIAGTWTEITVPLSALGNPQVIRRINIQNASATAQAVIYLDNIRIFADPVDTTAPSLPSFLINDGAAQRSMVKTLTITFAEDVLLTRDPFSLLRSSGSIPANVTLTATNRASDRRTWDITFLGSSIVGGSLPDGIFNLILSATNVYDLAGNAMASGFTRRFHRLFGDSDGDRDVDNTDLAAFRLALNKPLSYVDYFDYDANGTVINSDYAQFKQRLTRRVLR